MEPRSRRLPSPLSKLPHAGKGNHDEATPSSVKCRVEGRIGRVIRVHSWRWPEVGKRNVSVNSHYFFQCFHSPVRSCDHHTRMIDIMAVWRHDSYASPYPTDDFRLFFQGYQRATAITSPRLGEAGGADAGTGSLATGALRCQPAHSALTRQLQHALTDLLTY